MGQQLKENISKLYGDLGVRWLSQVPHLAELCAKRWDLTKLEEMPELSFSYVMSGYQDTRAIILKLSPEPWTSKAEARALKGLAGHGVVSLLGESEEALLLERACPGLSLKEYFYTKDIEAIDIFCQILNNLHQAPRPQEGFVHIRDWLSELENQWPLPTVMLDKARILRDRLCISSGPDILLHGDLHHGNILQHWNHWVAIDPKGVKGEACYEAGAFIRNPIDLISAMPRHQAQRIVEFRIEKMAHFFGVDQKRLAQWCFVQAVLAWIWAFQDGLDTRCHKWVCELFEDCDLF